MDIAAYGVAGGRGCVGSLQLLRMQEGSSAMTPVPSVSRKIAYWLCIVLEAVALLVLWRIGGWRALGLGFLLPPLVKVRTMLRGK
jgi:hypothetical protein